MSVGTIYEARKQAQLIREMKNNKLHALLPIRNKWMLGRTSQIAMKQSYTEAGETS